MMAKFFKPQTLAVLVVGALLGYLAATGGMRLSQPATASPSPSADDLPQKESALEQEAHAPACCPTCRTGASRVDAAIKAQADN